MDLFWPGLENPCYQYSQHIIKKSNEEFKASKATKLSLISKANSEARIQLPNEGELTLLLINDILPMKKGTQTIDIISEEEEERTIIDCITSIYKFGIHINAVR